MFAGKPSVIAGRLNRIMAFSARFPGRDAIFLIARALFVSPDVLI